MIIFHLRINKEESLIILDNKTKMAPWMRRDKVWRQMCSSFNHQYFRRRNDKRMKDKQSKCGFRIQISLEQHLSFSNSQSVYQIAAITRENVIKWKTNTRTHFLIKKQILTTHFFRNAEFTGFNNSSKGTTWSIIKTVVRHRYIFKE